MAKMQRSEWATDDDVVGLVQRVGEVPNPKNYIREYVIKRTGPGQMWVTVTFIADDQFLVPDVKETDNG